MRTKPPRNRMSRIVQWFLALTRPVKRALMVATDLVVIPLALWMFRRADLPKIVSLVAPAFLGFLVFFIIRGTILKWHFGGAPLELMNNPFVKLDAQGNWAFFNAGEKMATIIYTLGKYIMLLFAPFNLTHDYYPRHIAMMKFSDPAVLLSLATYIGLAVYAVRSLPSRSWRAWGRTGSWGSSRSWPSPGPCRA